MNVPKLLYDCLRQNTIMSSTRVRTINLFFSSSMHIHVLSTLVIICVSINHVCIIGLIQVTVRWLCAEVWAVLSPLTHSSPCVKPGWCPKRVSVRLSVTRLTAMPEERVVEWWYWSHTRRYVSKDRHFFGNSHIHKLSITGRESF